MQESLNIKNHRENNKLWRRSITFDTKWNSYLVNIINTLSKSGFIQKKYEKMNQKNFSFSVEKFSTSIIKFISVTEKCILR